MVADVAEYKARATPLLNVKTSSFTTLLEFHNKMLPKLIPRPHPPNSHHLLANHIGQVGHAADDVVGKGVGQVGHQCLNGTLSGNQGLHCKAHKCHHGKAAILHLLDGVVLGVLVEGVEWEGVDKARLCCLGGGSVWVCVCVYH